MTNKYTFTVTCNECEEDTPIGYILHHASSASSIYGDTYHLSTRPHACKPKEKPVNEACLFKPVLMRNPPKGYGSLLINDDLIVRFNNFNEYIYVGRDIVTGLRLGTFFEGDVIKISSDFTEAKRIPGYDYGDNDE